VPRSNDRRRRLRASAAALLLGLAACGPDERSGPLPVLVEVVAHRLDGEPPKQGLAVRRAASTGPGPAIPLVPVPGRPNVYEAPGAEEGRYVLALPDGWGPLFVGVPPYLQPDGRPTRMNAGRPHTMYLASIAPGRQLGETWAAKRVEPSGALGAALRVEVQPDGESWVLLRFRPEEWAGAMAVQGRFTDGSLTELVLTTPAEGGRPILRQLNAEPTAPLVVTVVGAEGAPGAWVRARVLGLPLDEVEERPVRDGAARFEGLATSREGLEVTVGEGAEAATHRFATTEWARAGELRLLALGPGRERVDLGPSAGEVLRVQLRPEAGSSYGLVPFEKDGAAAWLGVPPGDWRALVETATGVVSLRFAVRSGAPPPTQAGMPLASAVARGTLKGAASARVVWERLEDGRAVLGHGFTVRARGGAFESTLPPGTYRLSVANEQGVRGRPTEVALTPGQQLSLPPQEVPADPEPEREKAR
jgi:hypothetical protein